MTLYLGAALVAILSGIAGLWVYFRPTVKRGTAALDAILGEQEVTDRGGQVITPAQPGLVHRVASVEKAVIEWSHLNGLYAETQGEVTKLKHRVKALEDARTERIVTKAESAEMWRAVANADVIDEETE